MTIRRLNYTKRLELRGQQVQVILRPPNAEGVKSFSVALALPDGLPKDAVLSLEAYCSNPPIRQRFDLGTVFNPQLPAGDSALLRDFQASATDPLFRFKVIDVTGLRGKIVANADQIRPVRSGGEADTRQGLLHITHQELEGPIWELHINNPSFEPTLIIDSEADAARELSRDPKFIALVYPEVFRRVLTHLIISERMATIDDPGEWGYAWYDLAKTLPGMSGDALPRAEAQASEREEWIENATRAFAWRANLRELIRPQTEDAA
jgi:hypothetical protein